MGLDGYWEDVFDERNLAPQTNYDRIRNMSVDEMAEWFMHSYDICELDKPCNKCIKTKWCSAETKEDYKQWLLAESE